MSMQFTIGADPEVFVKKNGKAISAYGLVPGTKDEPFKTDRGAYQVDGMALEFNINPSKQNDFASFNLNIVKTVADLRAAAGNVNLAIEPVMEFDPDYIAAQPPAAKELGCDPDYNAYTLEVNPRPDGDRPFRTGAGHLHIGWGADIPVDNEEHMAICGGFVKMLDATVGMLMTYIDRDSRRRELYGKAGAFRPKSYGVEYRTPSNVWIRNKARRFLVHSLLNKAIMYQMNGSTVTSVSLMKEEEVREVIDTGDWLKAKRVLDRLVKYNTPAETAAWKAVCLEMKDGIDG